MGIVCIPFCRWLDGILSKHNTYNRLTMDPNFSDLTTHLQMTRKPADEVELAGYKNRYNDNFGLRENLI